MSRTSTSSSSELLRAHCAAIAKEETVLREGGGKAGHERQRKMGRLPARERISHLLDKDSPFFEIGLWAAYKMYEQWGKIPAAGVVAGIGNIAGVPCMIIANDATVKAASAISENLFNHELTSEEKKIAGPVVHYAVGATGGLVYGVAAELAPEITEGVGLPYGAAFWLVVDEGLVPLLGFATGPTEYPLSAHVYALASHLVFGATAEGVRRLLRG